MIGYIYKITNNKDGKCYIGKTTRENPITRWVEHFNNKESKLSKDMNKLGIENFSFEIIDAIDTKVHDINNLEQEYIRINNSYNNGYNILANYINKKNLNKDELELQIGDQAIDLILWNSPLVHDYLYNPMSKLYNSFNPLENRGVCISLMIKENGTTRSEDIYTEDGEGLYNLIFLSHTFYKNSDNKPLFNLTSDARLGNFTINGESTIIDVIIHTEITDAEHIDVKNIEHYIKSIT